MKQPHSVSSSETGEASREQAPLGSDELFRALVYIAGGVAIIIALATLASWVSGKVVPGGAAAEIERMLPLTAIGVVLCGAGLIMIELPVGGVPLRWLGLALGLTVVAVGGLVLVEYIFMIELGIDTALLPAILRSSGLQAPDRTPALAGTALLLSGLAVVRLGLGGRGADRDAQVLGLAVIVIALAVVIGSLIGSERFTELPGSLPLTVEAAFSFLALAFGILAATPRAALMGVLTARDSGGRVARWLIPVAVLVPTVVQILVLLGRRGGLWDVPFGISLMVTTTIMVMTAVIWFIARDLSMVDRARVEVEQERARLLVAEYRRREEEERIRRVAEHRARQEAVLQEAAESIAGLYSIDDVIREIARHSLDATGADLAFVERIHPESAELEVLSVVGEGGPVPGIRIPYESSLAREVIESAEPVLLDRIGEAFGTPLSELTPDCPDCAGLIVPLVNEVATVGVLILIRRPEHNGFSEEEIGRGRTFATLASLAFRKIHLLEDSEARRRKLEEVTESRARLIRGFSHDLKNPLGAADGYAELLEEGIYGELNERQAESIGRIRRALQTALGLIGDLVELARSESGQLEIDRTTVEPATVIQEVAEEHRGAAESAGLTLEVASPGQLPPIYTDPRRVRQILGNLLTNAIKYTPPEGRIEISAARRAVGLDGRPGDWLTISVRDTGPGIPPEDQRFLFQEFIRLTNQGAGVGLGLAISQRIAHLLRGDLSLESEVGKGSTFTLWLPYPAGEP